MQKKVSIRIPALLALVLLSLAALPGLSLASHKDRIEGPINNPQDVTKQCLQCHEDEAHDFMNTVHWTWGCEQDICDQKSVIRGKKNAINNYCTSVAGNMEFCAKCHAGYGWKDNSFDFKKAENIDCLVCHDTTGTYRKGKNMAGLPANTSDELLTIARKVGEPSRYNCGACHFFGGGGDAVKHGDLDSSMEFPELKVDVHMSPDGQDFQCQACHETSKHLIGGNSLGVSPGGKTHFTCEKCHDNAPHSQSRLNAHVDTVACQTCHIPYYAKEIPTKIWWDWSTAGQDIHAENDKYGKHTYVKKKGNMKYGKMLTPEYHWYNGTGGAYLRGEPMNPKEVTKLAYPIGERKDKTARIYPFKVMRGKQIYDKKHKNFITAKVAGEGGYWKDFDWDKAARLGSKASGLPYSGKYGFAETEMYWRLNHMVSPAKEALTCLECHGDNGRLDWKALGYKGDPMTKQKWARTR